MVVCKFFLQGTCKFGDNCKFEHQINRDHNYGSSILIPNYNKPQTTSNVDTNVLVKAVFNDMTSAEKGGQWLLSSYAPFKEKPAFPGFEDHSMEEVRHLFYEAVKNGTVEQYKQNLQVMLQQAMMKIKALQNPSPDAVNMLKNIYDMPPSSSLSTNQTQAPFGGTSGNSVFGGAPQNQKSIFGNSNSMSTNAFDRENTVQPSIFSGGGSSSIFGGGAQNTNNSVFGQTQNQSKGIFGAAQPPTTANKSIFGNNLMTGGGAQQSIFSQQKPQTSPFGQQNLQPMFPNNVPTQQQSIFQQNPHNAFTSAPIVPNTQFGAPPNATVQNINPFGQSNKQPINNPFGTPQPTTTFPATQPAPGATTQPSPFQHTQSIFGNPTLQPTNNIFATAQMSTKPNPEFYSKLEELTEQEIKWFQSDDLDIENIPEKPPTYEMCF